MTQRIEDYALIGDTQTAALVGRDGSIDWACFPRFDSPACFASLLGKRDNGRWSLAPAGPLRSVSRRYRPGTLILETEFVTDEGAVRVVDFMPVRGRSPDIIRVVEGLRGRVTMETDLVIRFEYGSVTPWVRRCDGVLTAIGGADALCVRADVPLTGRELATVGTFDLGAGERRTFVATWYPSHEALPPPIDVDESLREAESWWRAWSQRCTYRGPWREAVVGSLMVLKALTYQPTGGIVAAPTTSLPEHLGGPRNWDYRFCWLRDATLTLLALMRGGYRAEAAAWRSWLLRAVAGDPARLQAMYGIEGQRRLTEYQLGWLPGYEGSSPVRIGNAAHQQLQLDVYGEIINAEYEAHRVGIDANEWAAGLQRRLLEVLETAWREPDEGIWEVRGPRRHFTHSKVMAWVAFDRAVKLATEFGFAGPVDRWRARRDEIHAEVLARGFDRAQNSFTQSYDRPELDASALMFALVGFLPARDSRIVGTVAAVERELMVEGFVRRYNTETVENVDGLPPGEGTFLPCTFWLADNYALLGRRDDAVSVFCRLLAVRNDVGLLAEEYDPGAKRQLGNFPQAFSHFSLVNSGYALAGGRVACSE